MRIIGCDLHARQQTLAMLDTITGEMVNRTLMHEGKDVREFYSQLPAPMLVGIEATGSMRWFLNLLEELGIECQVGYAAKIRAAEPRKQKHDRRDAELILKLLVENRFPAIWRPTKEHLDLRALLLHRHQWVRLRTQIQNALQAIALANGLRRGPGLWSYDGQAKIASLLAGVILLTTTNRSCCPYRSMNSCAASYCTSFRKASCASVTSAFLANRRRGTLLPLCFHLLGSAQPPQAEQHGSGTEDFPDSWRCPKCDGPMKVIERLTAAEIQLRSPPRISAAA
jgi:rubredoxin